MLSGRLPSQNNFRCDIKASLLRQYLNYLTVIIKVFVWIDKWLSEFVPLTAERITIKFGTNIEKRLEDHIG